MRAPLRRGGDQVIPRPPEAVFTGINPWAEVLTAAHVTVERIESRLADLAAGKNTIPPAPVLYPPVLSSSTRSATLAPLFVSSSGETRIVLTRRSARLRTHSGEVAFPGGRIDEGETALDAALREAWEEIALPPAHVRIIGQLEPLATRTSASAITPFIGVVEGTPELVPAPREVARVFDVALLELASPDCYHEELWPHPDVGLSPMHIFEVEGDTIWGATGRMLHRLLTILAAGD